MVKKRLRLEAAGGYAANVTKPSSATRIKLTTWRDRDRQTDRQRQRQRQTDRQKDRQTDRQTDIERCVCCYSKLKGIEPNHAFCVTYPDYISVSSRQAQPKSLILAFDIDCPEEIKVIITLRNHSMRCSLWRSNHVKAR